MPMYNLIEYNINFQLEQKYRIKNKQGNDNECYYLIDSNFQKVKILFGLAFEVFTDRIPFSYYDKKLTKK